MRASLVYVLSHQRLERDHVFDRLAIQRISPAGRHDSENGALPVREQDLLANNFRIASEGAPPKCISQEDDGWRAGFVFRLGKCAAQSWLYAEHIEDACGNRDPIEFLRLSAFAQDSTGARERRHRV